MRFGCERFAKIVKSSCCRILVTNRLLGQQSFGGQRDKYILKSSLDPESTSSESHRNP